MRSNVSVQASGIITYGKDAQKWFNELDPVKQDEATLWIARKIAEDLDTTVTGLVLHFDETAPHAHYQLPAYSLSGKPIHHEMNRHSLGGFWKLYSGGCGRVRLGATCRPRSATGTTSSGGFDGGQRQEVSRFFAMQ